VTARTKRGVATAVIIACTVGLIALVVSALHHPTDRRVVSPLAAKAQLVPRLARASTTTSPTLAPPVGPALRAAAAVPAPDCHLGAAPRGPAAVRFSGVCDGQWAQGFGCSLLGDEVNLTAAVPLDGQHTISIKVHIEPYDGPGTYPGASAEFLVSVVGPPYGRQRWSTVWGAPAFTFVLHPDNSVDLTSAQLVAEPFTGTRGNITLSGHFGCVPGVPAQIVG
jgi:hypothetical protein